MTTDTLEKAVSVSDSGAYRKSAKKPSVFPYFNHLEKQIALASTKVQLLVATIAILLIAYIHVAINLKFFQSVEMAYRSGEVSGLLSAIYLGAFLACGGCLFIALVAALFGTVPKTTVEDVFLNKFAPTKKADDGFYFYGTIAGLKLDEFLAQAAEKTEEEYERDLQVQVWAKSKWLAGICERTRLATWMVVTAVFLGFGSIGFTARLLNF